MNQSTNVPSQANPYSTQPAPTSYSSDSYPRLASYESYSKTVESKQPPPYVDSTMPPNYGQNQTINQPTAINTGISRGMTLNRRPGVFTGAEEKAIRRAFVRKVYSILMIQLLATFGIISIFQFVPTIRTYIRSPQGQWAYWSSYAIFLVVYITLACFKKIGRKFPFNIILLSILTLSMSYMMGMISAYYKIESVFIAVAITSFVCLGVTVFSFQTKFDFTSCVGVLFVISLALVGFGIACIFTYSRILYTVYAGLGAIAFSIFLAVDTQMIMGGKRHEISAEDYIFASIMLYLDVVYIFVYILMLFGKREQA